MRFLDTTFQELTLPFCLDYFFGHGTYGILGDSLIEPVSQALQASSQDDAMVAAVRAVGSAALANMRGCKQELVQARSQYCHAVKLAGESIRRGNISSPLNLVLTVLLLSYFEVVTFAEFDNMLARNAHLAGLVALLDSYGKTLLKDRTGLFLFTEIRRQIISSCLQRAILVPKPVARWSDRVERAFRDTEARIYSGLAKLQMEHCRLQQGVTSIEALNNPVRISQLYALAEKLQAWKAKLPENWRFETVQAEPTSDYQLNYYHLYRDLNVAAAWNDYRTTRIMSLDNILTHVDYNLSLGKTTNHIGSLSEQQTQLKQEIRGICSEVYASTPQVLGRIKGSPTRAHAGGINMVWTLFVFSAQRCMSLDLRLWASRQLDFVGHQMGVCQAVQVARMSRENARRGTTIRSSAQCAATWGSTAPERLWYSSMRLALPNYYLNDACPLAGPETSAMTTNRLGSSEKSTCTAYWPYPDK